MTARFFVFGSYAEGSVHWSRVAPFVDKIVPAAIRASVWRLKVGFPVLMRDGDDLIEGQLLELKGSDLLWSLLDEFHGCNILAPEIGLHRRLEVDVIPNASGQAERAWAYFLNPHKLPKSASRVKEGRWREALATDPPLVARLSERQKEYLRKLAGASGREIVPINDLSLYRELMNLELIVDKGRRLALSRFGQEVVRYLD